jgi:hypothetical protein
MVARSISSLPSPSDFARAAVAAVSDRRRRSEIDATIGIGAIADAHNPHFDCNLQAILTVM